MTSDRCFGSLIDLVKVLRGDGGCPWDRAQSPEKIKIYLIEEAYEVLDALESGTNEEICGELGDLLFHIVFLARLFEEAEAFDIKDVVQKIVEKMIRRHPHVFGETKISGVDGVKAQWHEIKAAEKKEKAGERTSYLDGVPRGLPVLMRAYRLGERAARAGFDWPDTQSVIDKLELDLDKLKNAVGRGKKQEYNERLGDLLFSITTLSRFMGVHPETALGQAVSEFNSRFECVEKVFEQQGGAMESATREEMDEIWRKCKKV